MAFVWRLFLLLLLTSAALRVADAQDCPCSGCGTDSIGCTAVGLTAFPALSLADRQLVEILRINQNGITSLSVEDLANFTSLQELYASYNNIHTIEAGAFSGATQLTVVDFESNNLQELPQSLFSSSPNLESINFRSNVIESISEDTFTSGHTLFAEIDLADNPLNCDCGLRWLPSFLESPEFTGSLIGVCSSPASLSGVNLADLTEEHLTCDCIQECVHGVCDMSVGQCACDDGYTGENCSIACVPGRYGAGCLQNCSCVSENEASPCNHTNGACHCQPGFTGAYCQEECPEGTFGQDCAGECLCENEGLCGSVTGVCACPIEWSGAHCNISSCGDGVKNNDESNVDCGGTLCPPCPTEMCRDDGECEEGQVCLGQYRHPSNLLYPYQYQLGYQCVDRDVPGEALLQKFKDTLRGREGVLSEVSPLANLSVVEYSVQQEIEIQFGIEEPLQSVAISTLEQARGDPLYQACVQWSTNTTEASMERNIQQIIANMDSGLLKGTILINREDRKIILNI